jgi:hypothetical protein
VAAAGVFHSHHRCHGADLHIHVAVAATGVALPAIGRVADLIRRQDSVRLATGPLDDYDCAVADHKFAPKQFWHLLGELGG